jgi:hypothetical protein
MRTQSWQSPYPFSAAVGDLDMDGRVDVLVANMWHTTALGSNNFRFAWYRNEDVGSKLVFPANSISSTAQGAHCIKPVE